MTVLSRLLENAVESHCKFYNVKDLPDNGLPELRKLKKTLLAKSREEVKKLFEFISTDKTLESILSTKWITRFRQNKTRKQDRLQWNALKAQAELARLAELARQGELARIKKEILAMSGSSFNAPPINGTRRKEYSLIADRWVELVLLYKSISGLPPTAQLDF